MIKDFDTFVNESKTEVVDTMGDWTIFSTKNSIEAENGKSENAWTEDIDKYTFSINTGRNTELPDKVFDRMKELYSKMSGKEYYM